jgi:hypothetical protein
MLASSYLMEILQILVNHIGVNGYIYQRVPLQSTWSMLEEEHGMRREVVESVLLRWFGTRRDQSEEGKEEKVELDARAIVQFTGLQLLETKANESPVKVDEFKSQWEQLVGVEMSEHVNVDLLKVRGGSLSS